MPNNQITINYIPDPDYGRLKDEAQAEGVSLNNLVRRRLGIPEVRPGNPLGSSRKGAKQPPNKKRGVRRTREQIQLAEEQPE
jgi:hypothetical protein